jgi:eukaryotic-like serine/threonine-protein kinase
LSDACPDAETLQRWLGGALPADALEDHLAACEACRAVVLALRETSGDGGAAAEPLLERGASVDRYLVLDVVGRGGMGVVYSAYDPQLDRKVALKVIRAELLLGGGDGDALRARLLREAQAMARLSHPNVLPVYDAGTAGAHVFIAMELVSGGTLTRRLAKGHGWRETTRLFIAAGRGLAAAHAAGLVHRDFKPDNVLIGDDERVRVSDFGLARLAGDAAAEASAAMPASPTLTTPITKAGVAAGTPQYMSPEQMRGADPDARGDQFSFCVALYEAVYGERPFAGTTLPELRAAIEADAVRDAPRAGNVPGALRRALLRGLRADAAARFATMDALLAELSRIVERRRSVSVAAGVPLVLMVVGLAVTQSQRARDKLCRDGQARLAGVWDEDLRQRTRAAFAATHLPYADLALRTVESTLDRFAGNWARMHDEACAATAVRHDQSTELLDLRMDCLNRRLAEAGALTTLLSSADAPLVSRAVQAVQGSDDLAACSDVRGLRQRTPPPADMSTRKKYDGLQGALAELGALNRAGRYGDGAARAGGVVDAAKKLDHPVLLSDAYRWQGMFARMTGHAKDALAALHQAAVAAERASDDGRAAAAFDALAYAAVDLRQLDDAGRWLDYAGAAAARAGEDHFRDAVHAHATGLYDVARQQPEAAVAAFERAARLHRLAGNAGAEAISRSELGKTLADLGRLDDAAAACSEALRLVDENLGPSHPYALHAVDCLGRTEELRGRPEAAEPLYRRVIDIDRATYGERSPAFTAAWVNLAGTLVSEERFAEALTAAETAERAAVGGQIDPYTTWLMKLSRGQALVGVDRAGEALPILEVVAAAASGNEDRSTALFWLARGLWQHGDKQRSRTLAREATALAAHFPDAPAYRIQAAAMNAWLQQHR